MTWKKAEVAFFKLPSSFRVEGLRGTLRSRIVHLRTGNITCDFIIKK
jgi:hypothetical protein